MLGLKGGVRLEETRRVREKIGYHTPQLCSRKWGGVICFCQERKTKKLGYVTTPGNQETLALLLHRWIPIRRRSVRELGRLAVGQAHVLRRILPQVGPPRGIAAGGAGSAMVASWREPSWMGHGHGLGGRSSEQESGTLLVLTRTSWNLPSAGLTPPLTWKVGQEVSKWARKRQLSITAVFSERVRYIYV